MRSSVGLEDGCCVRQEGVAVLAFTAVDSHNA
jgi:hypothetical protein